MKIGEKIRNLREGKEFSQEYIAEKLGMSVNGYGKIERGEVKLSIDRLYEIAEILEVQPEELVRIDSHSVQINTFNQNSINQGTVICFQSTMPATEKQYYEEKIKLLEEIILAYKK